MTLDVRFESEASHELDEAALWYEGCKHGLGTHFLDAVDRALTLVQQWPHAAPLVTGLPSDLVVRRAPIGTFPYRVVYMLTETSIRVLAIAHDARRPRYWAGRIRA